MSAIVQCSNCGAPARPGSPTCTYCHAVFAVPPGTGAIASAPGTASFPPGVVDALRNGNKIEAIRLYREAMKCSLLDAKNTVEALEKKLGIG